MVSKMRPQEQTLFRLFQHEASYREEDEFKVSQKAEIVTVEGRPGN